MFESVNRTSCWRHFSPLVLLGIGPYNSWIWSFVEKVNFIHSLMPINSVHGRSLEKQDRTAPFIPRFNNSRGIFRFGSWNMCRWKDVHILQGHNGHCHCESEENLHNTEFCHFFYHLNECGRRIPQGALLQLRLCPCPTLS